MINKEQFTPLKAFDYETYISNLQQYIIVEYLSTTGELNWGRIICIWNEKKDDKIITHTYAACVDGITGEIYVDDRPSVIFTKIFAHMCARPLFTIVKTICHLTLFLTLKEIGNVFITKKSFSQKIKNIFKSIVDIVLTPLYGLALTVSSAAILTLAPFKNEILYDGRKFLGHLENRSNWDENSDWILTPCFHGNPIEVFKNFENAGFSDTVYQNTTSVGRALTNFARAQIRHKIKHFNPILCYCHSNQAYTSWIPL
jgi:hypothetical protein